MPDAVSDLNASLPSAEAGKPWNYTHLAIAWVVGLLFKLTFLPCMCAIGSWRTDVGMWFDALIVLRVVVAYLRRETGQSWIVYAGLCYTSAFWIHGLTSWILKFNGASHC